jgi:hypothetical protein
MANVVSLTIRPVDGMPEDVRKANSLGEDGFVEIKVENSEPSITLTKIGSPSKKFKALLAERKVSVEL